MRATRSGPALPVGVMIKTGVYNCQDATASPGEIKDEG